MDVRLVMLPPEAFHALLAGDLEKASAVVGVPLPPFFLEEAWLWRLRLDQVTANPDAGDWVVRAVVTGTGEVVGHAGFHGPPDEYGVVEVGYTVVPEHRGQGWAHAALQALLARATGEPGVRLVRASAVPDNVASIAVLTRAGFVHVGQVEEEDGVELVFERPPH